MIKSIIKETVSELETRQKSAGKLASTRLQVLILLLQDKTREDITDKETGIVSEATFTSIVTDYVMGGVKKVASNSSKGGGGGGRTSALTEEVLNSLRDALEVYPMTMDAIHAFLQEQGCEYKNPSSTRAALNNAGFKLRNLSVYVVDHGYEETETNDEDEETNLVTAETEENETETENSETVAA